MLTRPQAGYFLEGKIVRERGVGVEAIYKEVMSKEDEDETPTCGG